MGMGRREAARFALCPVPGGPGRQTLGPISVKHRETHRGVPEAERKTPILTVAIVF